MKKATIPRGTKTSWQRAKPATDNGYLLKRLRPQNLILYADKSIVAINKPRGLVCQMSKPMSEQDSDPQKDDDLMSVALRGIREALHLNQDLRTVHRLDKQTSGVLLLARTAKAAQEVSRQMQDRKLQKTYLALVHGEASDFPSTSGVMATELVSEDGRMRVVGGHHYQRNPKPATTSGEDWVKQAVTKYRVLATSPIAPISLLELDLVTGVKHQIRAQLAQYLGTPILSDHYGPLERTQEIASMLGLPRIAALCLHSSRTTYTRFARTGPKRVFSLGLGAPIPPELALIFKAAQIELDVDQLSGGAWIDNEKVRGAGTEVYQLQRGTTSTGDINDTLADIGGVWYGGE